MAGLLDFMATPEGQGLLSMVAGGLAGARRGAPINSLGIAGLAGLRGYDQAIQRQDEAPVRDMRKLQMEQLTQQMTKQKQLEDLAKQYYLSPQSAAPAALGAGAAQGDVGPTAGNVERLQTAKSAAGGFDMPGYLNAYSQIDPIAAMQLQKSLQPKPLTVGKNDRLMVEDKSTSTGYKTLLDAQPDLPTGMQMGRNGSPEYIPEYLKGQKDIRAAGKTSVNVNSPYEPQFDKEMAGLDAKTLDKYRSQAEAGRSLIGTVNRLEMLNPKVYEAGGSETKLGAANFLAGMGMNVDPNKLANSQEFESLSTKAVMDSLGGSLGTGVSNADVAFIKNTVPQLGHSMEARKQIIAFMRNKANSQIKNWNDAQNYALKNRGLKGFNPAGDAPGNSGGAKFLGFE